MNKILSTLTPGEIPQLDQLGAGDIGINNADGTLFIVKMLPPQNGQTLPTKSVVQVSGVTSFNNRIGDVTLTSDDISIALSYTPVDPANTALTGTPTAPTATAGASTKQIANTEFVTTAIKSIVFPTPSTSLNALTDVQISEDASIDGFVLSYSNNAKSWVATQLASVAKTGQYSSLTGTPVLAAVATSGSYTDLSNKPAPFSLQPASASVLGGVKIGDYINVTSDGTISVPLITALSGLSDVSVTEDATSNNDVLMFSVNSGKWQSSALAKVALTGNYSDLQNIPGAAGVRTFNGREGAVSLEAADITSATGALLDSPNFTGIPTAPTASTGTNTTQIATTEFVASAVAALVNSAPSTLDTLNQLATALGDDPNFATTMTNELATKAPLDSPELTGTPTAPTAEPGTNTEQIATTAFVLAQASNLSPIMDGTAAVGSATNFARADHIHPTDTSRAPLASPALTGTPTAPTPASGTNNTQIATTAFVASAVNAVLASNTSNTSLSANGFQQFSNGTVMQWGRVSGSGSFSITFPLAFPNACTGVWFTPDTLNKIPTSSSTNPPGPYLMTTTHPLTRTGCWVTCDYASYLYYFAIGY